MEILCTPDFKISGQFPSLRFNDLFHIYLRECNGRWGAFVLISCFIYLNNKLPISRPGLLYL
jgi:hypothetical protein